MLSRWLTVGDDAEGQRIDNFLLRTLKGVPKSHIYRILRSGEVRVNKGRVGPDARLARRRRRADSAGAHGGAGVAAATPLPSRAFGRPILYEDDALIAVDKPAGLAVHGGSGIALGVIEQLRAARPDAQVPRARPSARPRHVRRAAGREEARRADGAARAAARRRRGQALSASWCGASGATRSARSTCRCTSISTRGGRAARPGRGGRPRVARRCSAARRRGPSTIRRSRCSKPSSRPAARIRSACTWRISALALAGDDKYGDFAWNRELARGRTEADVPARAERDVQASGQR